MITASSSCLSSAPARLRHKSQTMGVTMPTIAISNPTMVGHFAIRSLFAIEDSPHRNIWGHHTQFKTKMISGDALLISPIVFAYSPTSLACGRKMVFHLAISHFLPTLPLSGPRVHPRLRRARSIRIRRFIIALGRPESKRELLGIDGWGGRFRWGTPCPAGSIQNRSE